MKLRQDETNADKFSAKKETLKKSWSFSSLWLLPLPLLYPCIWVAVNFRRSTTISKASCKIPSSFARSLFFFSAQRVMVRKNIISELRRGTYKGGVIRFFNVHVEVTSKDSNPKDVAISHGSDALSPTHRVLHTITKLKSRYFLASNILQTQIPTPQCTLSEQ